MDIHREYESIESHLSDPLSPPAQYLNRVVQIFNSTKDSALRGIAGFQLFVFAASGHSATTIERPDFYLNDKDVVDYLYNHYCKLPLTWQEKLNSLSLYETGTTSFILQSDEEYVLKIIQPKFRHTRNITEATKDYKTNFRFLGRFAPTVHESDDVWILMDFVPGKTLTAFSQEFLHTQTAGAKSPEQLATINEIVAQICEALKGCLAKGKHHLDLSPNNIIVEQGQRTGITIHLIDFGVNYLLQEHVGSVGGLSRAQIFIAPELQDATIEGDEISDIFSIGMIFLEMLGVKLLEKENLSLELDAAWLQNPDLAEIVEDLIDENPSNRLINVPRGAKAFDQVNKNVAEAVNISKLIQNDDSSMLWSILESIKDIIPYQSIKELARRRQATKGAAISKETKSLLYWAIYVQFSHLVVISVFVWLILGLSDFPFSGIVTYDKRICDQLGWCLAAINVPALPKWNGAFGGRINGFLPGRLVALSFSIILARYYANIFATVTFRHSQLREMKKQLYAAEFFMRAHPFIGLIPILYALLVDPKAWPYCSAAGLLFICVNNWLACKIGNSWERLARNKGLFVRPSPFMSSTLADFSEWWRLVFLYILTLIVVGWLLSHGYAKDEWLYAIYASVFINILIMLRVNCVRLAPNVRTMLRRMTWWLERIKEKSEGAQKSGGAPNALLADERMPAT